MYKYKLWTSRDFRNWIQDHYQIPNSEEGDWNFLEYILLNPYYEKNNPNKNIMSGAEVINDFYKEWDFSAIDLMNRFERRTGINLNIVDYEYKSKVRTIHPDIDNETKARMMQELSIPYKDRPNRVCFSTGDIWTQYQQNEAKKDFLNSILGAEFPQDHPAHELVEHLHSKRVHRWITKQMGVYCGIMLEAINKIPDEERRLYASAVFLKVRDYALIQYSDVNNSKRVYAKNNSILSLPREIRKIFFSKTWDVDLKSAQLCIVAKTWDVPKTKKFIDSGGNIWDELSVYLDLPKDDNKQAFKEFLYGLFYGMSKTHLQEYANVNFGSEDIFAHSLIKELFTERQRQLKIIKENKGATDIYGNWIKTEVYYKLQEQFADDFYESRSTGMTICDQFCVRLYKRLN